MKRVTIFLVPCALAALLAGGAGCSGGNETAETGGTATTPKENLLASALIEGKSGSTMRGAAYFTAEGDKISLTVQVTGVEPGEHAVHIHEHPDCSAGDAESAGGHWNPTMEDHGKWGVPPFHLGDIGNITVSTDGTGRLSLSTDLWSAGTGEPNDVVGHAIMVHADPDDFVSQPSGNAGARIGCGPILRQ
jgi:superoxide dismutase, Cu-Zn family